MNSTLFGLDTPVQQAQVQILPVPWDATTSYGRGAALGPQAVLQASPQLDLFYLPTYPAHEVGFALRPIPTEILELNERIGGPATEAIAKMDAGAKASQVGALVKQVNEASSQVNQWVYEQSQSIIKDKKLLGVLGGDHSSPYGAIQALSENIGNHFGILHIDAHADLREAYQGFTHSHASIMYNVMAADWAPKCLVQVGIRDFCQEEYNRIQEDERILTFFDNACKNLVFEGTSWMSICDRILEKLPKKVYISFDIDGLNPSLCPHTGTPVPGGLEFDQASYLLNQVVQRGHEIVGFDLCEVAPHPHGLTEWDGNVGARILFQLASYMAISQGICHPHTKAD